MSLPKFLLESRICNKDTCEIKKKLDQYEDPDDLTLFYMWLDEKAKDKMKQLQEENKNLKQINEEHRELNGKLREENKHIFANVNDDQLLRSNAMNYAELQDYKTRNEKAIEKCINKQYETNAPWLIKFAKDIENILQGKE